MMSKYLKALFLTVVQMVTIAQFALAGDSRGGTEPVPVRHVSPRVVYNFKAALDYLHKR